MRSVIKAKFKIVMTAGLFLSTIVSGGLVIAQNPDTPVQSPAQQPQTSEPSVNMEELRQRIQKRKTDRPPQLTFMLRSRIQSHCSPAQSILKQAESGVKSGRENRLRIYDDTLNSLSGLSASLKGEGVDTKELDSQIQELEASIKDFKSHLDLHQNALGDVALMECAADPEGFWATLEEARASQRSMSDAAKSIKTELEQTIKPALLDLKTQLSSDADISQGGE